MENSTAFDSAELMHLALHATKNHTPDKAIFHLKRLLKIEPENGPAHYLLGALHAEIGMHDQAVKEISHALELEPDLPTARFQLGLLHITAGRVAEAEAVWGGLDVLGGKDPLFLFKKGVLHLVRDEFDQCVTALSAGIDNNSLNEDLNNDMRRLLQDAERAVERQSYLKNQGVKVDSPDGGQRMLLSLYETQENEDS